MQDFKGQTKKYKSFLIFLLTVSSTLSCTTQDRNCYKVHISDVNIGIDNESPVIIDNSIYGYVEEVSESRGRSIIKICSIVPTKIPIDSEIFHGQLKSLGKKGFVIVPSIKVESYTSKDILTSVFVDSLNVNFISDKEVQDKLIEIFTEFHESRSN